MISHILSLILVLSSFLFYFFIIRPRRRLHQIVRQFQAKGYKVHHIPFQYMKSPVYQQYCKEGQSLQWVMNIYPNYDVVVSNVMFQPMVQLVKLDLIKEFYSLEGSFAYKKSNISKMPLKIFLGDSMVVLEGERWKRRKKTINSAFTFDIMKSLSWEFAEICDESIRFHQEKNPKNANEEYYQYPIIDLTTRAFANIIMESFLGGDIRNEKIDGVEISTINLNLFQMAIDITYDPLYLAFGIKFVEMGLRKKDRSFNQKLDRLKTWGKKFVNQRIKQAEQKFDKNPDAAPKNILETLIQNRQKGNAQQLTEEDIFNQFRDLFTAGTITTAHFLNTTICLIALHPQIEKKLRQEIQTFMSTDDYAYENLRNLRYIDCIFKENSRLYGPNFSIFLREPTKDHYLANVLMKKGTLVNISMANHYSDKYFRDPFEFRPERWEKQCDDLPSVFVNLGFNGGPRACIGRQLALLQSKIALIKFMKRYSEIKLPLTKLPVEVHGQIELKKFKSKFKVA